jgi:tetraacyldisaccharide 4'-kinase
MIKNYGLNVVKDIEFPDHYSYTNYDIERILKQSKNMNANIITTEKDFYRLEGRFNEIQVIKSDLQILDEKKLINSILKNNENN